MESFSQIVAALIAWVVGVFSNPPLPGVAVSDLTGVSKISELTIKDAIQTEIVLPLNLPDGALDALHLQFGHETAYGTAWYFQGPQPDGKPPTYNLFNRHAGSGRGEWTHVSKYVGPGDPDIRIFSDVYQSARDYVQLMQDAYYSKAYAALQAGDYGQYFHELDAAGFDAHGGGYANLARKTGYVA